MELQPPGVTVLPEWRPDGALESDNGSPAGQLGIGGLGKIVRGSANEAPDA
jgi:hypothetical protein